MELSRVQAVLLDMDGTLVDSDGAVERSWRAWAAEYPVDPGRGPLIAPGLPARRDAKRAMREKGLPPRVWAPWVLIGDPR